MHLSGLSARVSDGCRRSIQGFASFSYNTQRIVWTPTDVASRFCWGRAFFRKGISKRRFGFICSESRVLRYYGDGFGLVLLADALPQLTPRSSPKL